MEQVNTELKSLLSFERAESKKFEKDLASVTKTLEEKTITTERDFATIKLELDMEKESAANSWDVRNVIIALFVCFVP